MYSMGQEFGQGSAGMAHLCSTMSVASAGEPVRDIRDSIWLGAGVILRLLSHMSCTWTRMAWRSGSDGLLTGSPTQDFSVWLGVNHSMAVRFQEGSSHKKVSESKHSMKCMQKLLGVYRNQPSSLTISPPLYSIGQSNHKSIQMQGKET